MYVCTHHQRMDTQKKGSTRVGTTLPPIKHIKYAPHLTSHPALPLPQFKWNSSYTAGKVVDQQYTLTVRTCNAFSNFLRRFLVFFPTLCATNNSLAFFREG